MQHAQVSFVLGRNDKSYKGKPRYSGHAARKQDPAEGTGHRFGTADAQRCPICGRTQRLEGQKQGAPRMCSERCQEQVEQTLPFALDEAHQSNASTWRPALRGRTKAIIPSTTRSPPRLIITAEDLAIEGRFWSGFMPTADQSLFPSGAIAEAGAPYQMLREIISGSSLVKRCAQAMAFANVGRENDDRRLNLRGAQIYHAVLRQTADLISARISTTQQRDDLLACCLVMCAYEMLRDDREPGSWYFAAYNHHVKGLCQVLQTMEVSEEPSVSLRYAWREARFMTARSSMFVRQPVSRLKRPPQPASTSNSLVLEDDMLDDMFALAQWFPSVDKLMRQTEKSPRNLARSAAVKSVVDHGLSIGKSLIAWEERAMTHYCNEQQPSLYSLCSTAGCELLNVLTHYWMVCMLLHSQLQMMVARFSLWYRDLELPFWIDPWPFAVFIVVVGPLSSHPRFGLWSAMANHTPMIATIFYFAASGNWDRPEARDLRDFVENKHRPGNALMRKFFYGLFARTDVMIPQTEMVKAAQTWYGVRESAEWKGADESSK